MAKTGDTPVRKSKAKAKAKPRAARPSFTPAVAAPPASSPWVYRSDTAAPAVKAPPPPSRQPAAPVSSARGARVTHALDVLTLPISVSLMAVLAPMRWLLGPPSRH